MRLYAAYAPPGGEPAPLASIVLLREGFNWFAFFTAPIWALARGLWVIAAALIAGLAAVVALPLIFGLDPASRAVLIIGYAILAGTSSNGWWRVALEARGYRLMRVVLALDRAHATLRLGEEAEPQAPPPETARPAAAGPPLDLGPSPGFWS